MLLSLIWVPLGGGILCLILERFVKKSSPVISLLTLGWGLAAAIYLWSTLSAQPVLNGVFPLSLKYDWIKSFGITFSLAVDGISILFVVLNFFIGIITTFASINTIREQTGFFYFNLLWTIAFMNGVFLAVDLFLFYVFWELMLVPIFLIIILWGHEKRRTAAMKFFLYSQAGSFLMLLSIIAIVIINGRATGGYSFSYSDLLAGAGYFKKQWVLMMGFFIAFTIKMGIVPFHGWLPDAYTQAPLPGTLLLASLMSKTGAYGLLRFVIPLFTVADFYMMVAVLIISVLTIYYGAFAAFGQVDIKRFISYTSISHMGYILLGVFVMNAISLQGTILLVLSHAITTGALFLIAGSLYAEVKTRDMNLMGRFWSSAPRMGGFTLVFALAAMGLPGTGNFIGEFLILTGTFRISIPIAAITAGAMILSVVYALWMIQKIFQGDQSQITECQDLSKWGILLNILLVGIILWIGIYPSIFVKTSAPSLSNLRNISMAGARGSSVHNVLFVIGRESDELKH